LKFRFFESLVLRMLNLIHLKVFIGIIKYIFLNENWSWSMWFLFFLHNFLFQVPTKFQSVMHMYLKNSQSQSCTFMHKIIVLKFLRVFEWFLKFRFNTCKWQFVKLFRLITLEKIMSFATKKSMTTSPKWLYVWL